MPTAARKILGLKTHSVGQVQWAGDFHDTGDVVEDRGHTYRARQPVARGHRPRLPGASSEARQQLVDDCNKGWAAGTTGGLLGSAYTVTNASDDAGGTIPGSFHYGAKGGNVHVTFDPDVFPIDSPTTISLVGNTEIGDNITIDGYGAGVRFRNFPIEFRTDPGSPIVSNRGKTVANIIISYIEFLDYREGSVVEFGGNNPWQRGGSDLVYLQHLTVHDTSDQMMSNGQHANNVSRSTTDSCKFGPSPGPIMMSLLTHGGVKLFQVDAADKTADTITTLDALGNPTNHDLITVPGSTGRGNWSFNSFRRDDLTAHPFPTGITPGDSYSVRHVGKAGQPVQTFTANSTTKTLTCTAHGYSDGDVVVLSDTTLGTSLPSGLRNGYIYFVRDSTANTFRLTVTNGGSQKGFTTNGTGTLSVQKADLTKFQISVSSGQTGWTPVDITGQGTGWYVEETEPLYPTDGKGSQWGSHHDDDMPDGFMTFTTNGDALDLKVPHLISDGQAVRVWAQAGSIPTPLVQGTTYYADVVDANTFNLAATPGGAAIHLTSGAAPEQSVTFTGSTDTVGATGHTLAAGGMVAFYGGSLPTSIRPGVVYWVAGGSDATITADTFQITQRKGDVVKDIGDGSGTLIKKPPQVQLLIGPNRATIVGCDFDRMKIRSPKLQVSWAHEYNCRVQFWGDPDRADGVGGCGVEMGDQAQALIEGCIFRPYSSSGTDEHYWSAFTNPREKIPVRGRSIYGINADSGTIGAVTPSNWDGGAAVIQRANNFLDGATTRWAASGQTVIVNSARLDWYDPADPSLPVPYDYELIDVTDPFILDTILDRGAGNVQPWELVT